MAWLSKEGSIFSIAHARASSQWNAPECVPMHRALLASRSAATIAETASTDEMTVRSTSFASTGRAATRENWAAAGPARGLILAFFAAGARISGGGGRRGGGDAWGRGAGAAPPDFETL